MLCALLALCTDPSVKTVPEEGRPTVYAEPAMPSEEAPAADLELTSTAFAQGDGVPAKYSCDGEDISPPLSWSDPPDGTKGFALICDDPDAPVGIWVHWVLSDIPVEARSLPEAVAADAQLPDGSRNGKNGWDKLGYGGPCPPSGTHRYFFKLYALDTTLGLPASAGRAEVEAAMEGHVLAQAELMGTYTR